eukprot:1352027-Amorphochlora_amoeboformis.AAC.2
MVACLGVLLAAFASSSVARAVYNVEGNPTGTQNFFCHPLFPGQRRRSRGRRFSCYPMDGFRFERFERDRKDLRQQLDIPYFLGTYV